MLGLSAEVDYTQSKYLSAATKIMDLFQMLDTLVVDQTHQIHCLP